MIRKSSDNFRITDTFLSNKNVVIQFFIFAYYGKDLLLVIFFIPGYYPELKIYRYCKYEVNRFYNLIFFKSYSSKRHSSVQVSYTGSCVIIGRAVIWITWLGFKVLPTTDFFSHFYLTHYLNNYCQINLNFAEANLDEGFKLTKFNFWNRLSELKIIHKDPIYDILSFLKEPLFS